ncbi:hypothetical protein JCM3766R1_004549 [Sporobolomyces carnicolor]
METWSEELSLSFMPLAWICSSTTSSNLLIKLLYQREPQTLTLLATDLRGVYYESLRGRQLNRRIDDAVASSSSDTQAESIGVMAGVGREGEALAERVLDELVDATTSGRAKAEMTEEGFDQFIDITLPSATQFRFVLFKLETESAQILATHLIEPLLGTSSALLSLVRHDTPEETDLVTKLEPAIDASGRAERLSPGKNCSTFFRVGGAGLLKRWEQSVMNAKTKRNDPLQLSLPAPRPAQSRSVGRAETISRTPATNEPLAGPSRGDDSPSKQSRLASKMLDHRSKTAGEKVGWEDSQPSEVQTIRQNGKDRDDVEMRDDRSEMSDARSEPEEEPATDEEAEVSSRSASKPDRGSLARATPPPTLRSPGPTDAHPNRSSPAMSRASAVPPSPTIHSPPSIPPEDVEEKKAKKKRKAEEEEAEALARRKAKFALLQSGPPSSKKPRRGGIRGL